MSKEALAATALDWRILFLLLIAAVAYSDLHYFYYVSERLVSPERSGYENAHRYVLELFAGALADDPPQSRMLQVWLYMAIWTPFSALLDNELHAIQLSLLAVQSLAAALYFIGALLFCRALIASPVAAVVVTLVIVQALLSTQFSYPFGGAFREGFFFLGAAMAFALPGPVQGEARVEWRLLLLWMVFFAVCATARYDVAMLVALIGFLIALARRQWNVAALHIGGTVVATVAYRLVRWSVGATDTVSQNFYEVDASGTSLRFLLAMKNLSFPLSLLLLFNVGLLSLWFFRRYCDWPRRLLFIATLLYSIFLVFVGSHVEPRLWIPMAGVLMALAAHGVCLSRQQA